VKGLTDLVVKRTDKLSGTIKAPSSKSYTHRAIIAAALSENQSKINSPLICDDTLATIDACRMLGAEITQTEKRLQIVSRAKPSTPMDVINCRDSASTMRFLTPICALTDGISVLTGGGSLRRRPMEPVLTALSQLGVQCYSVNRDGRPPLVVFGGGIDGGKASVRGDLSSQFVSGLLLAAPMAKKDTDIVLSTPLESKPYVSITLDVLKKHGIKVEVQPDYQRFHVPSSQKYTAHDHEIEGDYSSAAFPLAAAALTSSHVKIENLLKDSIQGDRVIIDLLQEMGIQISTDGSTVEINGLNEKLKPVDVSLSDNPDLIPVIAVLACFASGQSVIRNVGRLRFKESDRVAALLSELTKMGAKVRAANQTIQVTGVEKLYGAELNSHGDHRIAMACIVAALKSEGAAAVHGVECINKSYPDFIKDLTFLGGKIVER
jgi:3-phosphoshikimate 1-carboxyvinyltransferase